MKHSELAVVCLCLLMLIGFVFSTAAIEMYVDSHFAFYLFFSIFSFAIGMFALCVASNIIYDGFKDKDRKGAN